MKYYWMENKNKNNNKHFYYKKWDNNYIDTGISKLKKQHKDWDGRLVTKLNQQLPYNPLHNYS